MTEKDTLLKGVLVLLCRRELFLSGHRMPYLYFLSIACRRHTLGCIGLALELRLSGGMNELQKDSTG